MWYVIRELKDIAKELTDLLAQINKLLAKVLGAVVALQALHNLLK